MRRLEVGLNARRDIDQLLIESEDRHGVRAAARYRRLLAVAFGQLRRDPAILASRPAGPADLRLYALRFAARDLPAGQAVRNPPHVILYGFDADSVSIRRVLHAAMDLPARIASEVAPGSADDDADGDR